MITTIQFRAMGCQVEIKVETPIGGEAILSRMPARFDAFEDQLSRFRPDSELMRLNAHAGEWVRVGDVLFDHIRQAKQMARLTEGLFNPLVLPALVGHGYDRSFEQITSAVAAASQPIPDWQTIELNIPAKQVRIPAGAGIDLGGIAKGWVAQQLARELAAAGPSLVNIGGDIAVCGAPEGQPGWEIEIADPDGNGPLASVWLHDSTIVTSGIDYRRWTTRDQHFRHHLIHPHTGDPAETDVRTVTLIHPHAPTAEAYAKAVLLKGSEAGLHWLNTRWHAAGLVVRQDGAVLATTSFTTYFQERIPV